MPLFDPVEFLPVAVSLAGQDADEASLRTAVGRAYYAMFLLARDKLGVTTTDRVHGEVIRILTRRNRRLGDQMRYLLNLRLAADYEILRVIESNRDWRNNWARVQKIVALLHPQLDKM